MEQIRYTPLYSPKQEEHYFRLLTLWHGPGEDYLRCTLEVFSLEHSPPYEALSYVWGDENASTPLLCDRVSISIKKNLEMALRQLRNPQAPRRLWIDALCINQQDLDERAQQVLLMRKIYSQAGQVLVWIGQRTEGVEHAFTLSRNLAHYSDVVSSTPSDFHASFFEHNIVKALADAEERGTLAPSLFAISELSDLFDRPWFSRIWCVQEIVASGQVLILCGDLYVSLEEVIIITPLILSFRARWFSSRPIEFWGYLALQKFRNRQWSDIDGSIGLLEKMLTSTRDFQATDPRDKVFALMGIVDEGKGATGALMPHSTGIESGRVRLVRRVFSSVVAAASRVAPGVTFTPKFLKIDYRKSVTEVYRDAVRFQIRKPPGNIDILSHVQHLENPLAGTQWPSWVPDWSKPRNTSSFSSIGIFCADRKWAVQHDSSLSPTHPNLLFLEEFPIDIVTKVTDVLEIEMSGNLDIQMLWLQLFENDPLLTANEKQYNQQESLLAAFFMTLIVGELGFVFYDGMMSPAWASAKNDDGIPVSFPQDYERAKRDSMALLLQDVDLGNQTGYQAEDVETLFMAAEGGNSEHYHRVAKAHSFGRRLFLTSSGRIGLGPRVMQPGDVVVVLFGARMPFILRPQGQGFCLLGDAYVRDDDVMWGRASNQVREGTSQLKTQVFGIH